MSAEHIIEQIKQATDFQINKRILKEKIDSDLLIVYKDGLFKCDYSLIAFLSIWDQDEIYLEDSYNNPICVNRLELLALCKQQYQLVMNEWHAEHNKLQSIRKI